MSDVPEQETQKQAVSARPAVAPSLMASGHSSPVHPTAAAGTELTHPPHANTGAGKGVMATVVAEVAKTLTINDLTQATPANFKLNITAVKVANSNYDPKNAVGNLNAQIQNLTQQSTGLDIPPALFRTLFVPPDTTASSMDHGSFLVRVPEPLLDICTKAAPPIDAKGPLAFTGDDKGNSYALTFAEYFQRTNKASAPIPQDTPWFHLIPKSDTKLTDRELYEMTSEHIAKFGFTILDHPEAFHKLLTKDKEQASGKYHVSVSVNHEQIPQTHHYYDMTGIDSFEADPETHERVTIWFAPQTLRDECRVCSKCFHHIDICKGHEGPPNNDGKRKSKAVADANAKARIAAKAAKASGFSF